MAVLAPIPIATIAMVSDVKAGVLRSERTATRRSCATSRMTDWTWEARDGLAADWELGLRAWGLADARLTHFALSSFQLAPSPEPPTHQAAVSAACCTCATRPAARRAKWLRSDGHRHPSSFPHPPER